MVETPAQTDWRYAINYGPEGEANYANVYDGMGALVSNLRIHHAKAVVDAMNRRAPDQTREALEAVAIRIDEEWRAKGGLNCTEVCAIVRAALSGAQSHWGGIEPHHYELAAKSVSAAVEGVIAGLAITDEEAREIADFVLTETFGRTPTPPAAKEGE